MLENLMEVPRLRIENLQDAREMLAPLNDIFGFFDSDKALSETQAEMLSHRLAALSYTFNKHLGSITAVKQGVSTSHRSIVHLMFAGVMSLGILEGVPIMSVEPEDEPGKPSSSQPRFVCLRQLQALTKRQLIVKELCLHDVAEALQALGERAEENEVLLVAAVPLGGKG